MKKTARDHDDQAHQSAYADSDRLKLLGVAALMLLAGFALRAVGGPPRVPSELPHPQQLTALLAGSMLPLQPVALLAVDLAWLLWVWIVGSFALEALVVAVERVARGAAWVGSLRHVADRVTLPIARRAVAAAFAVQILSRGVPLAAAAPLTTSEVTLVAQANPASDSSAVGAFRPPDSSIQPAPATTYVVKAGDTLWSIAEQAFGSGTAYRRLVDANVGRRMADGQTFSARGVIQPGWELLLPEPPSRAARVETRDGQDWYSVEADDTLAAVAAWTLGDQQRWPELFELNRGVVSQDGRHTLTDPNVIWPGLRLRLPDASPDPAATHEDADADQVAAPAEPSRIAEADQVAASAVVSVAPPPSPADTAASPAADDPARPGGPDRAIEGGDVDERPQSDPLPLLRTAHALDPVVLEPADLAVVAPDAESTAPGAEVSLPTTPPAIEVPGVELVLGGLGLVALGGVALGARRVRRWRRVPHEPESEVVVEGGFAEAQLTHDLTRGLHGVGFDPLAALVGQLQHFLDEYHLSHVVVVAVRHGRSATTLTLAAGLAEQPLLVDLAAVFASRLEADVEAAVTADRDVVWRLVRLRRTRLLVGSAAATLEQPCLVPLGVLYDRQVYAANWSTLGHVLVASLPGHGADTILTSLVATLSARRSPPRLRVWLLAQPRALPAPVSELPHLARSVDPRDESALLHSVDDLRGELEQRALHGCEADLVVVIPELTDLGEHAANLELLAGQAAGLGVRFIAATSCPDAALLSPMMSHFGTRMVLRMQDEESSVALLGVADAAFLGGGGRLLLRLDGREPVELYGYQVAAEHLDRLVRVMRSAYPPVVHAPGEPPATPPWEPPSAPPQAAPTEPPSVAAAQALSTERITAALPPQPVAKPGVSEASPIRVICFGGPRIMCAGEQVWPRVAGGEVKPWEFLLYLACQPADGVSGEDAVEALWPEDDEADNAPHRFRQLRYRLRRLLNGVRGAPETDGIFFERGTLRLDPAIVYSDAQEFLSLVRSARTNPGPAARAQLEQARALYAGDLLEGPDARRYAWVDERDDSGVTLREHFRRLFQQASVRLAEAYAIGGETDAAMDVYRELTEVDAGDERYWRALFRLHAERGDRLGLVREEHRMRQALRELATEVDAAGSAEIEDPSREMAQEYQRLLAGLRDSDRQAATA